MTGAVFDDLIGRVGPEFDCLAPDLPGHASAADLPATLNACADMIADILGETPSHRPVVLGWSMGAAAAWRYIARHGTSGIGRLITVEMSPRIVSDIDWPHGLIGQSAESIARTTSRFETDWEDAVEGIATTMFAAPDGAQVFTRTEARRTILSQDPGKMRALWNDMVAMDARSVIPRIDIPYLVMSGACSRVYPASASDWIAEKAPLAKRQVFERSGHSPHLEEPEAFAKSVLEFAELANA